MVKVASKGFTPEELGSEAPLAENFLMTSPGCSLTADVKNEKGKINGDTLEKK